jgi:hypothetical protein
VFGVLDVVCVTHRLQKVQGGRVKRGMLCMFKRDICRCLWGWIIRGRFEGGC